MHNQMLRQTIATPHLEGHDPQSHLQQHHQINFEIPTRQKVKDGIHLREGKPIIDGMKEANDHIKIQVCIPFVLRQDA